MHKLHNEEKDNVILIIGCWLLYTLTIVAKINYTSSIAYIVSSGIFTKTNAGLIASSFYMFYGIGQMFGGRIVDRFSPYTMITLGVTGALISNLILCFTTHYITVLVVWSLSGLVQFSIWPGICRIISTDVLPEFRKKTVLYIQYGLPIGSLISYVCSILILEHFGWSAMFCSSAATMAFLLLFWIFAKSKRPQHTETVAVTEPNNQKKQVGFVHIMISGGIFLMLFTALSASMLLNGAQVWIPTLMMESYSISSGFASLQTVFIISIQIIGLTVIGPIIKRMQNPIMGELILFLICLIPLAGLQFIGKIPFVAVFIMFALETTLMKIKGVFQMQVSLQFGQLGYGGTYSGLSNAFASFGIVLASSCYGLMADKLGWSAVMLTWLALAGISALCCVPALLNWNKVMNTENKTN